MALLKIDCEGGEDDILDRLTAAASTVSQVSMEVHHVPGRSVDSILKCSPPLASMSWPPRRSRHSAGPGASDGVIGR